MSSSTRHTHVPMHPASMITFILVHHCKPFMQCSQATHGNGQCTHMAYI